LWISTAERAGLSLCPFFFVQLAVCQKIVRKLTGFGCAEQPEQAICQKINKFIWLLAVSESSSAVWHGNCNIFPVSN